MQSVIDEARKFGLTTPIPRYPSIFIGAADVYPIEMVAAYSAFATLGTRAAPIAITTVENHEGQRALGARAGARRRDVAGGSVADGRA